MIRFDNPDEAGEWCDSIRGQSKSIGFVPTMGALHDGHLSLVRAAREHNDLVCASIFVNPLQFNNPDDLNNYPRDLDSDSAQLAETGCDMVFTGRLNQFFPGLEHPDQINLLDPGPFAHGLEGEHRPGHFAGVYTIVDRLFRCVGACRAYFGEKDYQQSLVIRDLATTLKGIDVIVCPTVREDSGLAMSSRNVLLDNQNRKTAAVIYQALIAARQSWQQGIRQADELSRVMRTVLDQPGISIEYATARDLDHWTTFEPTHILQKARAFIAIQLAGVRLIDNLQLS